MPYLAKGSGSVPACVFFAQPCCGCLCHRPLVVTHHHRYHGPGVRYVSLYRWCCHKTGTCGLLLISCAQEKANIELSVACWVPAVDTLVQMNLNTLVIHPVVHSVQCTYPCGVCYQTVSCRWRTMLHHGGICPCSGYRAP